MEQEFTVTHTIGWGDFASTHHQFLIFFKGMGKDPKITPSEDAPFDWYEISGLTDPELESFKAFVSYLITKSERN